MLYTKFTEQCLISYLVRRSHCLPGFMLGTRTVCPNSLFKKYFHWGRWAGTVDKGICHSSLVTWFNPRTYVNVKEESQGKQSSKQHPLQSCSLPTTHVFAVQMPIPPHNSKYIIFQLCLWVHLKINIQWWDIKSRMVDWSNTQIISSLLN